MADVSGTAGNLTVHSLRLQPPTAKHYERFPRQNIMSGNTNKAPGERTREPGEPHSFHKHAAPDERGCPTPGTPVNVPCIVRPFGLRFGPHSAAPVPRRRK